MQTIIDAQVAQRDQILDALQTKRASLIAAAKEIAMEIAAQKGTVTGPQVFAVMSERNFDLSGSRRWMGCVFRGNGWLRAGLANEGSHAQAISVWRLTSNQLGEKHV